MPYLQHVDQYTFIRCNGTLRIAKQMKWWFSFGTLELAEITRSRNEEYNVKSKSFRHEITSNALIKDYMYQ